MVLVGHTQLRRCPFLDRDETRKRDRERRKRKAEEEEELQCKNTWVKYSLGLRHQVTLHLQHAAVIKTSRHYCNFFLMCNLELTLLILAEFTHFLAFILPFRS